MILVVINSIPAIPVFMSNNLATLPFLMLDIRVVVVMVPILRKNAAPPIRLVERIVSAKTVCSFFIENSFLAKMPPPHAVLFSFRLDYSLCGSFNNTQFLNGT